VDGTLLEKKSQRWFFRGEKNARGKKKKKKSEKNGFVRGGGWGVGKTGAGGLGLRWCKRKPRGPLVVKEKITGQGERKKKI